MAQPIPGAQVVTKLTSSKRCLAPSWFSTFLVQHLLGSACPPKSFGGVGGSADSRSAGGYQAHLFQEMFGTFLVTKLTSSKRCLAPSWLSRFQERRWLPSSPLPRDVWHLLGTFLAPSWQPPNKQFLVRLAKPLSVDPANSSRPADWSANRERLAALRRSDTDRG